MPPLAIQVVNVPLDQLERLIDGAVAKALTEHQHLAESDAAGLSARAAAKLARRRRADVVTAMTSGALKAKKRGSRWLTSAAEVRRWVEEGARIEA